MRRLLPNGSLSRSIRQRHVRCPELRYKRRNQSSHRRCCSVKLANIIHQRLRRGELELGGARAILARFLALPIAVLTPDMLYDRALMLAHEYDLPAIYDAQYVALAELRGATLWTADQRLLRGLDGRLSFVRSVADWQPVEDDG